MRKLATAALSFSAAIFAANYILPTEWLSVPAVLLAVLGAALAAMHRKWLRATVIALLFFAMGLLHYQVYCRCTVQKAAEYDGQTLELSGRILSYPTDYGSCCKIDVKITEGSLPHLKALVYGGDELADAVPGQYIELAGKLAPADELFGESYDRYHSKGIFFKINAKNGINLEDRGFDLRTFPARLSRFLSARVERIFPEDTAVFMKSLMLGDKQELYRDDSLYVPMTRAGFMHIVAVSGMHVAFLVGLLQFVLGKGRRGALICLALVWLFVLVTGATPSAVRAGFMQSLLLMAPVLRRENDPVTSLSAILAIILACNPFAAASISLQLSFGAMAGIICFSGKIYGAWIKRLPERVNCRALRYVLASVSASLGVMIFTLPLTAVHFGYVTLLSALTNIAGLWAVSLCFCGGWLSCALSALPALGTAAAWLCSWLARYIFLVARAVASVPFAVLYTETAGAKLWISAGYALLLAALLSRRRRGLCFAAAGAASLLALALVLICNRRYYEKTDTMTVINVGQGQCITAFAGDVTVMVDCGNIHNAANAGDIAASYLFSCGRKDIDALLLTHMHADHAGGVTRLMEIMKVGTIILPERSDDSDGLYDSIAGSARRHGTKVMELDRDATLSCGGIDMDVYSFLGNGSENERCLMTKLSIDGYDMLITADAPAETEQKLVRTRGLEGIEVLIVGHHGSGYSGSKDILGAVNGELAVISVGYNSYGHPSEETLERLQTYGYNVLRTDLDGTVEIRIG